MYNQGARFVKILVSNERETDVLPVKTDNSAYFQTRIRTPLLCIKKANLRTLDNVFVNTDIIEILLIKASQANLVKNFLIKSNFEETKY